MVEEQVISSVHNPRIRQVIALTQKASERRRTGLFVVEGRREVERCVAAGYEVVEAYSLTSDSPPVGEERWRVTPEVYERIAYRGTTEGIVAVVRQRHARLSQLVLPAEGALVVVVESVEKPGNIGAIMRSADAAGAHALIVSDPHTDLYNPNLIRASVGTCFSVPTVACTSAEAIAYLRAHGVAILTAQLQDSRLYYDTDMRRATAIVLGTEATGLTSAWREAADAHIRIPMLGMADSLNVSVSAAVLLYEAVRQRGT